MTEYELLRVISFLEKVRKPYQDVIPIADEDASWNMLLYLVKQNLLGTPVSISTLASVAKIPYATAMRHIHQLIERGHIVKKPVTASGRSFRLYPSAALSQAFLNYAKQVKSLLADTFGLRTAPEDEDDFYFGGSYFAAQIIPPPKLIESLFRGKRELHFLLNDDNYFASMCNMWSDFRNNISARKNFDLRKLPALHERLIASAAQPVSDYDIVALNMPWLGELV